MVFRAIRELIEQVQFIPELHGKSFNICIITWVPLYPLLEKHQHKLNKFDIFLKQHNITITTTK